MLKEKMKFWLLIVLSASGQRLYLQFIYPGHSIQAFLMGIHISDIPRYLDLCALFFPLCIFELICSGSYHRDTSKTGVLKLIRINSRGVYAMTCIVKILLRCAVYTALINLIYIGSGIVRNRNAVFLPGAEAGMITGLFLLGLWQYILEMSLGEQIGRIIISLYTLTAFLLWGSLGSHIHSTCIPPISIYARWNGCMHISCSFIWNLFLQFIFIFISIFFICRSFQRKDILS